jgi:hypothetical protein
MHLCEAATSTDHHNKAAGLLKSLLDAVLPDLRSGAFAVGQGFSQASRIDKHFSG